MTGYSNTPRSKNNSIKEVLNLEAIINIIFIEKHLGMLNQGKRYNSLIGYH